MTKEHLAAIKERLRDATQGPWGNVEGRLIARPPGALGEVGIGNYRKDTDGLFIANAPADIAALLEERQVLVELVRDMASLREAHGDVGYPITLVKRSRTVMAEVLGE